MLQGGMACRYPAAPANVRSNRTEHILPRAIDRRHKVPISAALDRSPVRAVEPVLRIPKFTFLLALRVPVDVS